MCTVNWKIKVSIVPSIYTEIMFFPIVFCNVKTSYYYAENHPPFKKKHVILRIISMNDCFSIASLHIIMQRTPPFKKNKQNKKTCHSENFVLWMIVSQYHLGTRKIIFLYTLKVFIYILSGYVLNEFSHTSQKIICSLF